MNEYSKRINAMPVFTHPCRRLCGALLIAAALTLFHIAHPLILSAGQEVNGARDAIVKIYTVHNKPDYFNPWRSLTTSSGSGSGSIIEGNRILTNSHVVADTTFIQVRRYGQAKKYNARVLSVSHTSDLALLTVDEPEFFEGVVPLSFGGLPETLQQVLVYGFPFGGDSLSITQGILSRIEHQNYTHSGESLLAGQIDAAINPGNSGGPVLVDNKIVGVVMQAYSAMRSENIGYMVPMPVIRHFLTDLEDGRQDGFPATGLAVQMLENPGMKRKYGMKESMTGIIVNHVVLGSPAMGKIERGDIILAVDGHAIGDDATVEFRPKERTNFSYFVDLHQIGETLELDIFRDGKVSRAPLELNRTKGSFNLVPNEQYDAKPRYLVFGGIVFSPLNKNLLKRWGGNWSDEAPRRLMTYIDDWITEEKREVVVALQVLAAEVNMGYTGIVSSWPITEINGRKIADFNEFYQILNDCTEPYITISDENNLHIVLDREKALATHTEVLRVYDIKEDRSEDLRSIL